MEKLWSSGGKKVQIYVKYKFNISKNNPLGDLILFLYTNKVYQVSIIFPVHSFPLYIFLYEEIFAYKHDMGPCLCAGQLFQACASNSLIIINQFLIIGFIFHVFQLGVFVEELFWDHSTLWFLEFHLVS